MPAGAKHPSRKTPGKRSALLRLQRANTLLDCSDKTQKRRQEAEEPVQPPAQTAAGKGAEAAGNFCCRPCSWEHPLYSGGVQGLYRRIQKGCSLSTLRTLGSTSILTDAPLSWNSIDIFLPCLQSKLLTDCLTFCRTAGTALPASSLRSSDTWGFTYTWPCQQLYVPTRTTALTSATNSVFSRSLSAGSLSGLLLCPFLAFKPATHF